jgi:hypothetical protein
VSEREFEDVMDGLTGLQARLRGEEAPMIAPRRVQMLPRRTEPQTTAGAIPTFRIERADEAVSVSHDDLTVVEDADRTPSQDHPSTYSSPETGNADVIPMTRRTDPRVEEISARLARLEAELTLVLRGLEDTEQLLTPGPSSLPIEESSGDPLTDLQRLVARRMESDPGT